MSKLNLLILFGGQSSEHEISLLSAKNIIAALDSGKYNIFPCGIDKSGSWWLQDLENLFKNENDPKTISLQEISQQVFIKPGAKKDSFCLIDSGQSISKIDCVFPVLHGANGEDGSLQGLIKLLGLPIVGCGVLSSAACMDKDICKRLLSDAGISNAPYLVSEKDGPDLHFKEASEKLGTPMFIKPASEGSSVGVSKVENNQEFEDALKAAFKFDDKVLIEEEIKGREIEAAVLGNTRPVCSLPGEVILESNLDNDFYSFENKYLNENAAKLQIPAKLSDSETSQLQTLAIKAFAALGCRGLARVDFFLRDGEFILNEINTLPGFTKISMYPSMWQESGIEYSELLDKLVELALAKSP